MSLYLFTFPVTAISVASAAIVNVVAISNAGLALTPNIHLFQLGSRRDFWPAKGGQKANDVSPGYYQLEVSLAGYRTFRREIEIYREHTDVRVVLTASDQTVHEFELKGKVLHAKDYAQLWVLLLPLSGNLNDETETLVGDQGHFTLTTVHAGSYVLAVVRNSEVLQCRQIQLRLQNPEVDIDVREVQ